MSSDSKLKSLFAQFFAEEEIIDIQEIGSGHINDTYKVICKNNDYLLQRINHEVFKDVQGLTHNLIRVNEFLKKAIQKENIDFRFAETFSAISGDYLAEDDENYWRLFEFIDNSNTFEVAETEEMAREGGIAYGKFTRLLHGFPAHELIDTIPFFHHAKNRIANFKTALKENKAARLEKAQSLVGDLLRREKGMLYLHELGEKDKIPMRATHNDTKISNVLFDSIGKGICVIDLDTIMPGFVAHDFGDAIRSFTNTAEEDEKDLRKVAMNLNLFKAFAQGFLSETKNILSAEEIDSLVAGAKYIVYEQTIRFLGDYLNGDIYYKTAYSEHNLVRARVQFQLLISIELQETKMREFIKNLSNS